MPRLLTQEWLDLQKAETAALDEHPGATARIQYEVSGGPDGPIVFHTHLEDGRIVENALGADEGADFTVLVSHGDYVKVASGDEDVSVGFMQGRIKVTGNIGRMLSVLPVTNCADWQSAMARVSAATTD